MGGLLGESKPDSKPDNWCTVLFTVLFSFLFFFSSASTPLFRPRRQPPLEFLEIFPVHGFEKQTSGFRQIVLALSLAGSPLAEGGSTLVATSGRVDPRRHHPGAFPNLLSRYQGSAVAAF